MFDGPASPGGGARPDSARDGCRALARLPPISGVKRRRLRIAAAAARGVPRIPPVTGAERFALLGLLALLPGAAALAQVQGIDLQMSDELQPV